jgi:hypothetical protein
LFIKLAEDRAVDFADRAGGRQVGVAEGTQRSSSCSTRNIVFGRWAVADFLWVKPKNERRDCQWPCNIFSCLQKKGEPSDNNRCARSHHHGGEWRD